MKFLVLLAVLFVAYLWWRGSRVDGRGGARRSPPPAAGPQEMVRCDTCGLHLPRPEAIAGPDGRFYCSEEHRLRAGG
jgi:uncharacterized protein